ncbi:hypothetical protein PGT21_012860 [Puccinia graminis f. sp. tritici]|uniref:Uncharacterized protein n=2 Tax=Puccinia graminis f. sp. tritici TaxID=56615 RepID=E3KHU1_PUCGT|nr:uncharacterized protein PGTG_09579 [Puccinia graminis f. sp. tritici CRL 75-36-700-3]KAA1064757.1 hypothetical protein PGT21_013773 [Puccinia graminis f. sp. tritici]EFP83866.1 hypothetical protein PGTG_09579 [Puccinia graminis f. sp. tritici CRL 75-36-700-3]KAA1068222.1 hypothetical protein PGTUg99_027996 [Puccinia graminis f. sp. tritici]KAA1085614.1 hypothetical protein PGT21_012860 [Puccinia graminis f. sp. tritici]KAA1136026.1 hypothetical protein PGTUg99_022493 [Puccinia graminis f. s
MQFSSFFKLCTLLLIQSGAVYSTFVCNDNNIEDAKVGICLRKINTAQDPTDPTVSPLLDKKDFLARDARGTDIQYHFTCEGVTIGKGPVEGRFCCKIETSTAIRGLTHEEVNRLCYSRDGKPQ